MFVGGYLTNLCNFEAAVVIIIQVLKDKLIAHSYSLWLFFSLFEYMANSNCLFNWKVSI